MTMTEACRRVALAALAVGALTVAHEALAGPGKKITVNGMNLQGIDRNGTTTQVITLQDVGPQGVGHLDAPAPAARAADPNRLRLRVVRPAGE
jgi:hypothetical protein